MRFFGRCGRRIRSQYVHLMERYVGIRPSFSLIYRYRWAFIAYVAVKTFFFLMFLRMYLLSSSSTSSPAAGRVFSFQGSDFNSNYLMDLTNFTYLANPPICGESTNVLAVVLVHTHPSHIDLRNTFRRQMPQEILAEIGLRRVFLIGQANKGQSLYPSVKQSEIDAENEVFRDMVQGNFEEHYRNLTYKHVMGLTWATRFCSHAAFIIKMDDDIAVDLFQVRQLLQFRYREAHNTLLGLVQTDNHPLRTNHSKWKVTQEEFSGNVYPPFLSGWCYMAPMEVVKKLAQNAHKFPYFWIDDVFVTGIMAEDLKIERQGLNHLYTIHSALLECCTLEQFSPKKYYCDVFAGPTSGDNNLYKAALDQFYYCYRKGCGRRTGTEILIRTCVVTPKETPYGRGVGEVIAL
ncbi:beta-1,3-galactosyltransferase 5 [Hyalella azteca]|uniref:Hexosyltransferase n=1 Tax=Hyalella azteca TaxID=294128 RepID=A0A8B7P1W8_HYAAZ|nr:beta-1,3-galactosyltransferase 5 [Hyalella azteca]XP_018020008.1 beta-1,3-galactosyltransferase 5 [Hyalella azteca]XP_047737908.1 beta-1,3-galactosyltransferase 5 [Hyalella azteca]